MTLNDIKENKHVKIYIKRADDALGALGYTEHSFAHVGIVANNSKYILETLGYSEKQIELVQIAAYLHDIGNVINRVDHAQSGAVMAFRLLDNMGMDPEDIATIISAIGNHDENTAVPINEVAAALIIADKTDVRCSRVRNQDLATFDIHDRVNYAVKKSSIEINDMKDKLYLHLTIDTEFSPVMDYFEIFLGRMVLCKKACEKLNMRFHVIINEQKVL